MFYTTNTELSNILKSLYSQLEKKEITQQNKTVQGRAREHKK